MDRRKTGKYRDERVEREISVANNQSSNAKFNR